MAFLNKSRQGIFLTIIYLWFLQCWHHAQIPNDRHSNNPPNNKPFGIVQPLPNFSHAHTWLNPLFLLIIIIKLFAMLVNYAFPTGSVYGFGKKRRKRRKRKRRKRTPTISESTSNIKILHITNKAGLFHILFGLIKF